MSGFLTLGELVDALIADVLAPSGVWRVLAAKAKITLAGSLYPGNWNQGTTVTARQLRWIGARQVELAIDVHSWTIPSSMDIEPWR